MTPKFVQSNGPDRTLSQSMLNFPTYKGSSAQLSLKQVPMFKFRGAVVGATVGVIVEINSGSVGALVQS